MLKFWQQLLEEAKLWRIPSRRLRVCCCVIHVDCLLPCTLKMHSIQFYIILILAALILRPSKAMTLDIVQIKSQLERQRFLTEHFKQTIMKRRERQRFGCLGCLELRKHTREYDLYLEYVKADILAKLGMKDRPRKAFSRSQIPAPIYEGKLLSTDDFSGSRTKLSNQIIIIGEKGNA